MAIEKVYFGRASKRDGQYGEFFTASINIDKMKEYANDKWYVNIIISELKEKDEYGNTHSVFLNNYKKPEVSAKSAKSEASTKKVEKEDVVSDMPTIWKDEAVGIDDIDF